MKTKIIFIFTIIFLTSCTYKPIKSHTVSFYEPKSFSEKIVYNSTKKLTVTWIHPASSSILTNLTGYNRLISLGKDFLKDIGGELVYIETEDKALIEGMYFNPQIFKIKEKEAFKKWKDILKQPKNCKLSQVFEVNFNSNSLSSFFNMPKKNNLISIKSKKNIGILCLPACGITYELDPKFILSYLQKGMHVLVINYRGISKSIGFPDWKGTCLDAKNATKWLKRHLNTPFENIIVCGKSFGTGPAIFAAVECKGANVIVDRGFARMSDVCEYTLPNCLKYIMKPFVRNIVEKFYRYPNEDWIGLIKGKALIIEALEDVYMQGQADRLFKSLCYGKTDQEKTILENNAWIKVSGGHYGTFWGDKSPSWYTDNESQKKVDKFLINIFN